MDGGIGLPPACEKGTAVSGFIIKPFAVSVAGHGTWTYFASSRGKALASAWRDFGTVYEDADVYTFRHFLTIANASSTTPPKRFGEPITVGGLPAFWVGCNRQYIQFVRLDSDVILNSHPYDVEPPEARRGTPYYEEAGTPPGSTP